MTDVLVFLDALSPRELGSGLLANFAQGELDAGVPRVTPRVMASIYTGEPPENNGLLSVSKYGGVGRTRPEKSTFIEQAVREDNDVLCVGMPFCIPFQTNQDGSVLSGTSMGGQTQTLPANVANFVNVPAPAADMIRDDPGPTYRSFADQVTAQVGVFREALRRWDFDIGILGIRLTDSYCHFQHTETSGGRPFRQHLIETIDDLLQETYQEISGDIMFFCYDDETEVLTKGGWKGFDSVSESDEIATLDQGTGRLEYQSPEKVWEYDYDGKMYRLKNTQVDLKVTPNHNLYVDKPDRRRGTDSLWRGNYGLVEAKDVEGSHFRMKKGARWDGESPDEFYLPDEGTSNTARNKPTSYNPLPILPWLRFLGHWVGDGTLHHDEQKGNYEVMIKQSKEAHPEEYNRMLNTMHELGFNTYDYGVSIKFYSRQVYEYLLGFWKPKSVPDFVKSLDTDLINEFIDGLVTADGSETPSGRKITTTSDLLRDDLQELALKAGYSINNHTVDPTEYTSKIKGRELDSSKLRYDLYLNTQNQPSFQHQERQADVFEEGWVDYDSTVHCVTVPNSVIYIRRNGKPVWCGNSDHGQTELETVFRVNRWLDENGWLEYKVDLDFIDTLEEYTGGEDHPVAERVENQVSVRQAGVVVDEEASQVIGDDPFDSCLTLLCDREDFDEEGFRSDLMATGLYRSVDYKWELYDEDAEFYDDMPDIIPDRGEGVFVSGNFHPEPIGMGWYRTGVHDRTGAFGASRELNAPDSVSPEGLYDVIADFLGLSTDVSPLDPAAIRQFQDDELESAYRDLQDRMYEQGLER